MGLLKRLTASALAIGVAAAGADMSMISTDTDAATVVVISPLSTYEINGGVFEGWGTSLCWWANRVGYSDTLAQKTADLFFGDNGLKMNIARFNIGGGDDPTHHHITRTDSNMPGYTVYNNGTVTYDWNADYNQRNVLMKCIKAAGDDMIVEMFSNSPPYYMTKSGCSTGNTDAGKNNLKDDQYEEFADYMAEVCYHYKNVWGVDIQSVEAMNEPYTNFWGAFSRKQEGCHFDKGSSESKIITELQRAMKERGMSDVILSGTDETSIDTQIECYNALSSDAKNAIGRIDTHTYGGSRRSELKSLALSAGKNLWMSEVDGSGTAGTNAGEMGSALWLAQRIALDCNQLNPTAWILWQAIDNHISSVGYNGNKDSGMVNTSGGFWGLAVADHDKNEVILTKKYYAFGQYSRYIRPGMIMLNCPDTTMAAYDPDAGQLVIVVYNTSSSSNDYTFDLTGFSAVGSSAKGIRTSNTENWKDIGNTALSGSMLKTSLAPNSITTFVIDGVKGSTSLQNRINVTKDMVTGSESWKNDQSVNYEKAFDGSRTTYFDGLTAGWVQVDLGKAYDISAIGFCPRAGYEQRMTDGSFQFSEDGTNWTTAYTVPDKPSGMRYVTNFNGGSTARYIRYSVPEGKPDNGVNTDSTYCCNVAEIELYGLPSIKNEYDRIIPTAYSGSDSWHSTASTSYDKAFDGDISTYFDGTGQGWVQADLGALYDIKAIGYCARKGYEYRMTDGYFQVSTDGNEWQTVYTINTKPGYGMEYVRSLDVDARARYIRYTVPEGKPSNGYNADDVYCCNISEIELYGTKLASAAGDIDGSGKADVADLVLLQNHILRRKALTSSQAEAADINADGMVDAFDLVSLRKILMSA